MKLTQQSPSVADVRVIRYTLTYILFRLTTHPKNMNGTTVKVYRPWADAALRYDGVDAPEGYTDGTDQTADRFAAGGVHDSRL